MTLLKNGTLSPIELGEQGYQAYRVALEELLGAEQPVFSELADNTKRAWIDTCTELNNGLPKMNGYGYQEVSRRFYGRLVANGAFPQDPTPYTDLALPMLAAYECVPRHILNCHQADDGDDLDQICDQLRAKAREALARLAGTSPQHA